MLYTHDSMNLKSTQRDVTICWRRFHIRKRKSQSDLGSESCFRETNMNNEITILEKRALGIAQSSVCDIAVCRKLWTVWQLCWLDLLKRIYIINYALLLERKCCDSFPVAVFFPVYPFFSFFYCRVFLSLLVWLNFQKITWSHQNFSKAETASHTSAYHIFSEESLQLRQRIYCWHIMYLSSQKL